MQIPGLTGQTTQPVQLILIFILAGLISACAPPSEQQKWDPLAVPISDGGPVHRSGIDRSAQRMSPAMLDLIQRADAAIEQQQWPVATGILERALRVNPKQAEAWTRMAVVNLGKQNPDQALQMAKKSNRYAADDEALSAYNWLLMSRAYEQLGQRQKAEEALATSRRLQDGSR